MLGDPQGVNITPIAVVKLSGSNSVPYQPTLSVEQPMPEVSAPVLSVASLLGLDAAALRDESLLDSLQALTGFLIEQTSGTDTDSLESALRAYEAQLPVMPDAMGHIRQLVKFAKLERMKSAIDTKLNSMRRQDSMDIDTWESFAKETGNLIPFLKAVDRKNYDSKTSDHSGGSDRVGSISAE